jgi:tetratricopeptide (TPR) repeat protein
MLPRLVASGLAIILGCFAAPAQTSSPLDRVVPPAPTAGQQNNPQISPEMRGDIFMARKMYREAIDAFKQGSPTDPVLWNKTGIAYHQMMQLDNARKSYERAIKLKKDYVEAINNLGTVYYAKKSYRRAVSYYKRALKLAAGEPKSASIYMNLGTAYFARKKYDDATVAYQSAMQLDPQVFERHSNYGVMLEERSIAERAKYHFYVAKLYAKDGRNDLAIQYLRKALEEGFKEKKQVEEAPEFAGLKDLPEFKELLTKEPRVL